MTKKKTYVCIRCGIPLRPVTEQEQPLPAIPFWWRYCRRCLKVRHTERKASGLDLTAIVEVRS